MLPEQLALLSSEATAHFGSEINKVTREYVGIDLFNTENLDYLTFFLDLHLENLVKAVMITALEGQTSSAPHEETSKQFFTHTASIICDALRVSIGKNSRDVLFATLEKQIQETSFQSLKFKSI